MAAPKKYDPKIHDKWAWSLAIRGATDKDIASAFDVTERTINRWKFEYDKNGNPLLDKNGERVLSSFGKSLQTGKDAADAEVEYSLHRRATGYRYTEVEKIVETDSKTGVQSVTKTRIVEKEVPPETMAAIYWLNNRKRKTGEWSQKQDVSLDGSIDIREQDRRTREMLDRMTDEQLAQYESLCDSVAPTG